MVWQKQKSHTPAQYKILDISEPGYGGLNIQDLDYTLPLNQSPRMLNMMVKNGAFGKRYGQKLVKTFGSRIYNMTEYKDEMYLHVGTSIVKYDPATDTTTTIITNSSLNRKGTFINYNKMLYYLCNKKFFQYDGTTGGEVEPYCPDVCINRTPDGASSDIIEDYNRLGAGYKNTFNGDGTSTTYVVMIPREDESDTAGLDSTPIKVEINGHDYVEGDSSGKIVSVNRSTGAITFNAAPSRGQNNVVITAYKTFQQYEESITTCKYWAVYGGQNNSRLFLGGNGTATYYFSNVFNAAYFPETNSAVVGNAEKDITGFGAQYNNLIIFKPNEIYALDYQYGQDTTGEEKAMFFTTQVNVDIGCDVPGSIQFIDNRLTWCHTNYGILTLCSTVIEDERNVRVVSRNINGGYRIDGLLAETNLKDAASVQYEGKYIIFCNTPASNETLVTYEDNGNKHSVKDKGGHAYMWDYTNAPYSTSERINVDTAAKQTAWFKWNNVFVDSVIVINRKIYYSYGNSKKLLTFTDGFDDEVSSEKEAIVSYYRTPMMDFGAYHMLKTVKRAFFEVRADTACNIHITYITDENPSGEQDPEDIVVSAGIWETFDWASFGYKLFNFAKTFARKCSIKKIMLVGIEFVNNEVSRDMSLSGVRCEYTLVKEIK